MERTRPGDPDVWKVVCKLELAIAWRSHSRHLARERRDTGQNSGRAFVMQFMIE